MGSARLDVLPVVSRANVHVLVGIVALRDVLTTYGVSEQPRNQERQPPP